MTALLIGVIIAWMIWAFSKKDPLKQKIIEESNKPYNVSLEIELEKKWHEQLEKDCEELDQKMHPFEAMKALRKKYSIPYPEPLDLEITTAPTIEILMQEDKDLYDAAEFEILKLKSTDRNLYSKNYDEYATLKNIRKLKDDYEVPHLKSPYILKKIKDKEYDRSVQIPWLQREMEKDTRKLWTKLKENKYSQIPRTIHLLVRKDLAIKGYRLATDFEKSTWLRDHKETEIAAKELRNKYPWY